MRYGIPLLLTLAGCSTAPTYHHWALADGSSIRARETEFNADWYDCVKTNTNDNFAVQCMKARGYRLAWSDNSDDSPNQAAAPSTR